MSAEKVPFSVRKRPDSTENVLQFPVVAHAEQELEKSSTALLRDLDSQMRVDKQGATAPPVPTAVLRNRLDDWLFECSADNQSKRTIEGKNDAINRFIWWLQKFEMQSFSRMDIRRYMHYVDTAHLTPAGRWDNGKPCKNGALHRNYRPVSDRTLQLYFVYIKDYLNFLKIEEVIPANPLANVRQPRIGKRVKIPLNVETEVNALLEAAAKSRCNRRDTALVLFLLDTGARVSEICGLHMQDVDMDAGTALVIGKGNKQRAVHFELDTARALRSYLKKFPCRPEHYLFRSYGGHTKGSGLSRQGVAHILTYLCKAAGLNRKSVSPHLFRRTFATELANSGCPAKAIQDMMGHKTMEMTMHYVYSSEANTREKHREHCATRGLRGRRK